jgi:hypothetical protein
MSVVAVRHGLSAMRCMPSRAPRRNTEARRPPCQTKWQKCQNTHQGRFRTLNYWQDGRRGAEAKAISRPTVMPRGTSCQMAVYEGAIAVLTVMRASKSHRRSIAQGTSPQLSVDPRAPGEHPCGLFSCQKIRISTPLDRVLMCTIMKL